MNRTASPTVEDVHRTAILEAFAQPGFRGNGSGVAAWLPRISPDTSASSSQVSEIAEFWLGVKPLSDRRRDVQSVETTATRHDHRKVAAVCIRTVQMSEIPATLSFGGRRALADRIRELHKMTVEEPDEPAIVLASLRELAIFFLGHKELSDPDVGVRPDGLLQAEWASDAGDVLVMAFTASGTIRYAATPAVVGEGSLRRVNGELSPDEALNAVRSFAFLWTPRDRRSDS